MEYFNYCTGMTMTNDKFANLFGAPARGFDDTLTQREMDLAASVQKVVEEVVLKISKSVRHEFGLKNLCLAGGVALNCVANGVLHRSGIFDQIWIQPAAGDSGGAVGAALAVHHMGLGNKRAVQGDQDSMRGSLLGPSYEQSDIVSRLNKLGAKFEVLTEKELLTNTASALAEGKSVGW
ncbi:MAG: carbamoyltransferase N-terminal domain-containing protein, partial [Actinomycetota bacterium]